MFLTKEAVRLALDGVAIGVGVRRLPTAAGPAHQRYETAGGRYLVCPICFNAKQLDKGALIPNAELGGTVQRGSGSATIPRPRSATDAGKRGTEPDAANRAELEPGPRSALLGQSDDWPWGSAISAKATPGTC